MPAEPADSPDDDRPHTSSAHADDTPRQSAVTGRTLTDHSAVERDVVDPDVDLRDPRVIAEIERGEAAVLAAIGVGGAIGATLRWVFGKEWPAVPSGFPWQTLMINLIGCAVLAVLMVFVLHYSPHRLLRPFLGVGVCGGFTTFSTFSVDLRALVADQRAGLAVTYLLATVVGCLIVLEAATSVTERAVGMR